MKKCSTCGREYAQPALNFCPEDGGALNEIIKNPAGELPPTVFSTGDNQLNQSSPNNPYANSSGSFGNNFGTRQNFNPLNNPPISSRKNKLPLILGGLALLSVLGGVIILAIGIFILFGSDSGGNGETNINISTKEGQVKTRLLDLFGNCQQQNHSAAAEFFYYRGQPVKSEEIEKSCQPIKNSLDDGNGYEFGNFLTQGAGEKEVAAWEVYFKRGAEKIGQIFAFQLIDGKYRLVDINSIEEKFPVNNSNVKTFDSLRQTQLGSFSLEKAEKSDYMKAYPNLEEESLVYGNSEGIKVFVSKTRFPSNDEAIRVLRDLIQSAKNRGSEFTETVPFYSKDGREVGVRATRFSDKGGAKNYTVYYTFDNVVTFIFSLEHDKAAVDEVYKASEY